MARRQQRQHSLRKDFVRGPSVLAHANAPDGFAISPREILEMNQDGLALGNTVRRWKEIV